MKKISLFLVLIFIASAVLSGCGSDSSTQTSNNNEKVVLKVAYFKGGFGDQWFNWLKEEFEKTHQNVTVQLEGDPNLLETIVPKIEGGTDAPDIFFINGRKWKEWGPQGYVLEISDLYESKVPGTDMTLNEYIQDAAKDNFFYDPAKTGVKKYAVPWSAGAMSIVYNKKLFDENGWKYPQTWNEFEKLCEEIKSKGIAPLTYPGQYLNYVRPAYRGWQVQTLGEEKFKEYKNPSSHEIYEDPELLTVWKKWESLFKNGWIMEGTTALNHTQSQMEFINEKVAMIFNGFWLENEMKEVWPEGYDIRMAPIPADGKLNKPTVLLYMPDYASIYGKTKHPEVAKEFLLFSLSPEASKKFAELSGGLRPLKYDLNDVETTVFTKSCMEIMSDSQNYVFTDASSSPLMYTTMGTDYLQKIATGQMTAEEGFEAFKKDAKKEYEKIKKDLGID